ncbi:amino acid adenylation domain-containing protein, partial [Chitinophaga ginsengisegetis]|uniref:non-ribosomal peptide synthetase n=1 Tax=Chitinophaga ginsengisegetis TaxID=393003 RepID=UPI0028679E41
MFDLLNRLKKLNVQLYTEGNDLKIKADPGVMSIALLDEIKLHKPGLLELLKRNVEDDFNFRAGKRDDYPLSAQQQAVWLLCQNEQASMSYNIPLIMEISAQVKTDLLEQVLQDVLGRHEAFSTSFFLDNKGEVRQRISSGAVQVAFGDLSGATDAAVKEALAQECMYVFDLTKAPLVKAKIWRRDTEHYLSLLIHHIIFDGASLEVLKKDFFITYEARLKGDSPSFEPPAFNYMDFAVWQQEKLEQGHWDHTKAFWEETLAGELPVLQLFPSTRPATKTSAGMHLYFKIPESLSIAAARFFSHHNVSHFTGLLAALNTLLYRYTGNEDLVLGTVVAERNFSSLQEVIGLFINTVPIRTKLNPAHNFEQLLELQQQVLKDAMHHSQLPFATLVEMLNKKRDASRSPVFDVMVIYNDHKHSESGANTDFAVMKEDLRATSQFDIVFTFDNTKEGLFLNIEFNTDLYEEAAIYRLFHHFQALLQRLIAAPDAAIYTLDYLSEEEHQQLLHTFNDTDVDYERGVTLPGLFRRQAALQPEATALVFKDSHFTYRELDEISGRLASYLHTHYTLAPEDLIGIKLHRSEWLIISLLAVLKAGCAYVPVDPLYPEERQRYIAEDSGYKACIDDALLETFREGIYPPDCYHEVGEDQLAYVLYTSGSSGVPKGCMLEHKGLINRLRWMWDHYGFTTADVVLQKTTFTFDVSVWELFIPLCFGCRMILSSDETVYSPAQLSDLIRRHKVSRAHFVPVMLARFIEEVDIASLDSLQHVFASGEALSAATVKAWYKRTAVPLSNLYGPTEASIEVSYYDTNPESDKVAIGKPIANTHLHILDQYSQQVPVGIAGEIHIGGIQLARGYHHRPDLTAEKFIDHAVLKERLYRTGDLGRWLSDGNIEYLGRIDDQVKVRGYRIEPGEVEHALKGLPGIAAAVVTAYKQSSGEQALAAYYLSDVTQDAVLLRQQLLQQLPEYMVPGYFTQLAALPLTPSGKVDRKALPAPEGGVSAVYVAPRNATEAQLVVIWQEVLRTDTSFSITDDFFVSGGHSLKVMQLINHYARHFEVKVSVQDLFHHTTISAHASLLSTQGKTAYSDIQPVAPASDYAVSDGQRRLWVLSQLEDSSRAYHLSGQMEVEEMFRSSHLETAINRVIGRHEILRTVFREGAGSGLRQVVLEPSAAVFKLDDAALENESQVPAYIAGYSGKVFDLGSFPLLRAGLIRLSSGRCIFHYTMHHIISDGWSMELLREEVLAYYNSYVKNEELSLSPLRIQYKDFTAWQQQQAYGVHKDYWETQFGGELPVLELPGSRVRPAVKTYNGYMLSTGISPTLTQGLQALCQQQQSTLFMGLLGVLNALFYRYTGQEDIIIGSPVAGREHAELEGQIGFYLNTVALRSRFSGGDNFLSLLSHIRSTTLAAYDHQSYPFDRLVDDLKLKRDTSRSALFDVMMVLQNQQQEQQQSDHLTENIIEKGNQDVKLDLLFTFAEQEDGLYMQVEFNTAIYEKTGIVRLLHHFKKLLSLLVSDPATAIHTHNYLSAEEQHLLLYTFNDTAVVYEQGATLPELFLRQVTLQPDAIALVYVDRHFTYRELDEWSGRLADYLHTHYNLSAEDLVGIKLQRSEWLVISLLAVLKAGCAYVPVDPSHPQERQDYIAKDSGYKTCIDETLLAAFRQDAGVYDPGYYHAVQDDQLAYVLYTSGSTGEPKGCMLEHRGLVNRLEWMWRQYGFTTSDIILQKTTFTFDVSVWELFLPLCWGCRMVLSDDEAVYAPARLAALIQTRQVTTMHFVPVLLQNFLEQTDISALVSLKRLFTSGEALPAATVGAWYANSNVPLYNLYGPTEASIDVSYYNTVAGIDKVPIGKPVANTRLYILDTHAQLVPVDVAGELHIGGIQLARGYHQRPALTAEKFVMHPALKERLYRTGDLARWLPDGNIEYLGRTDNQVKLRGYRIELGEVEQALQNLEGVGNAIVTVYTGASGERVLAAYFTSESAQDLSSLRQQLLLKLPEYMVPGYFMQLDEFPLTPSGKVNRKALPAPGVITPVEYIAPRNEAEAAVARIWEEVLKTAAPLSVTDDFFMLGGHSLKVVQLVNHYVQQFDVKLQVQALFHHTTIASHALLLSTPLRTAYRVITPVSPAPDYALSDGQRRVWVLSQLEDRSRAYYLSGQLELNGDYKPAHLETAILLVIQRHEILRTVFRQDASDELRQVILDPADVSFKLNYDSLEGQPVSAAEALITTFSGHVFDLNSFPLLRAGLIRLSENRYIFHYTMHHIISDGWSMEVLKEEIMRYYDACARGEKVIPAPLSIQYKDFATWQQQQLQSGSYQPHKEYWQSQFSGSLPVLQLPVSKPRPLILTDNGYCLSSILSEALTASLKALCRENKATLFMGLLGALKVLLYRYTGQEDIIIGSPVAGREHAALDDQIGFYMNTVALRTRFSGQDSFADLLQHIRKNTLTAYEYQSYPFDRLVDELDLHRNRSHSPLFDVMLTLQSQKENSLYENYDLSHTDVIKEEGPVAVKFDLHLSCSEIEGALYMELKYNQDIYDKADISRMFSHYKELLQALIQHPALPVNQQEYLTVAERQQLLETFNIVTDALPLTGKTVIDLFEEQAAAVPDKVAVVCNGEQLTYRALSRQANQLAHYLKSRGVGKEDRVVIAAVKSLELIVGFLGIMKAGAAFVPVDPAFPEERIRYILEDTGCKAVIGDNTMRRIVREHTEFIDLQEYEPLIAAMPGEAPDEVVADGQLAYVIYTSGSTGRPKGVMITHASLTDHIGGIIPRTALSTCTSFAILASLAADAYHSILFSSLVLGASVHILTDKILFDTDALVKYLEEHTIDGIKIFPSLWTSYAEQQIFILPVKVLIWGGEALPPKVIRQLRLAGYQGQVFNHYGPTEATIGVLTHKVDLARDYTKVPIGVPYSHSRIYILNEAQQLCPVGVPGELHIGGAGLAKGYLNKPALTTEKFIEDPFIAGARVYRTGDYARWLANGDVEYIGRIDDQVKINGYRIELGEIEFALQQLKGIQSAVVAIRTTTGGDKTLAAYFTAEDKLAGETLKSLLKEILPAYMIPHYFIQLDTLPLMANGKVDRNALSLEVVKQEVAEEIIAPRNEVEQVLLEVYQRVLKSEEIKSVRFSFFDQGGDSIKAILLASQLKQRGYAVKVGDVLKYPVLEDLARKVQFLNQETVGVQTVVKGPVGLMPVQRWFLAGNYAHKHHYNQSVLLSSRVAVNRAHLEQCLTELVAHHDALRMVYRKEDNSYHQYNRGLEEAVYHLEEYDLRQETDEQVRLEELCEHLQGSIDLSRGPLLKAGLFHLNGGDRLLLVIHHLVVDGVSWRILLEDLSTLYQQLSEGKPAQLPQKSDSFRDWAAHQQQQANSHLLAGEWTYWSSLTASSGTPLKPDMPAGTNRIGSSATEGFILGAAATRQLLTRAHRAYHTDINDVLLTCLLQSVQDVFAQQHLLLTLEGHGREDIGGNVNISRTVGWFTSMYPVLLESKPGEAMEDTLVRVKDQLRRIPRKGIGYGMLRYLHVSGEERLGGLRSGDITFNYLGDFGSGISAGDGA